MRAKILLSLFASVALGFTQSALAEPAEYTLTKQYGSVIFKVLQEEYIHLTGRFDEFGGTLQLDTEDLSATRLDASVAMGSLNMTDSSVEELLISSSVWFNTALYPDATFTTDSVEVIGENVIFFHGQLTFVGITRPLVLEATLRGGADGELEGDTIGMTALGRFKRSDFGLDQYMNVADDDITIEVNAKFKRN